MPVRLQDTAVSLWGRVAMVTLQCAVRFTHCGAGHHIWSCGSTPLWKGHWGCHTCAISTLNTPPETQPTSSKGQVWGGSGGAGTALAQALQDFPAKTFRSVTQSKLKAGKRYSKNAFVSFLERLNLTPSSWFKRLKRSVLKSCMNRCQLSSLSPQSFHLSQANWHQCGVGVELGGS